MPEELEQPFEEQEPIEQEEPMEQIEQTEEEKEEPKITEEVIKIKPKRGRKPAEKIPVQITEEVIKIKPKRGRKPISETEIQQQTEQQSEEQKEKEEVETEQQKQPGKRGRTRKKYEQYQFDPNFKINKKAVINRLPKREKFVVRTSNYYMNNRKLYIQKIAELFRPYRKEILSDSSTVSCNVTSKVDFKLLTHQKIVKDYLNLYTPYRGLLLYHGLGAGKTCSSIAIAEGMKTERPVVLMTPASLKMNFFSEIKKCGDMMYKKNQYWEFISTVGNPQYVNILSNILQIPQDIITRKKGAWLVDVTKKESNYDTFDNDKQKAIDEQLDLMIRAKYLDINYNGLNRNKLKELTDNFTKNPFDNVTVIIDEAHNFVSRIVNKIKKPNSISYILYDYLMKATNTKIVLLSGTPIINYPNELGILFNILRGYIKKWTFQLSIKPTAPKNFKLNKDEILKFFDREGFNTYDYVEFSGNNLIITRNPYGFINTKKKVSGGANNNTKKQKNVDKSEKNTKNSRNTRKNKLEQVQSKFIIENDIIKINTDSEKIKEQEIEPEALIEYNDRIFQDLHKGGTNIFDEYDGVMLDETGNLNDQDFEAEIRRILNKNYIEILEIGSKYEELKALPDDSDSFLSMFVDDTTIQMKNENTFKKRILGLTSYFRSAEEKLLPSFIKNEAGENYHIVPVEMSEFQFSTYQKIRKEEAEEEKKNKQKKIKQARKENPEDLFKIFSTYRIFSRAACNFAFPKPPGRPMPSDGEKNIADIELDETAVDGLSVDSLPSVNEYVSEEDVEELKKTMKEPTDYQNRIKTALNFLKYDPKKPASEQFLTEEGLRIYSPKFLKILQNIQDQDNIGLHLLYSQFRTIEGIGILKLVLEANGFAEFKIRKNNETTNWEIVENEEDSGKMKFVLYTGTESPEEKEIIRNIYNSNWDVVPKTIRLQLEQSFSNNFYGEVIKLMMITASGAEGINLKNTRFVHIVEPYWHMVRIEQVIGRARRICSHHDLPEDLRTVKVFLYLSTFSELQKTNKKNIEIMNRDISRIDNRPITTDETLFDTSILKNRINSQLLNAIKETAIDCSIYNTLNKDENLVCYGFGKVTSNTFSSYPTLQEDLSDVQEINIKKTKLKLKATKPIDGIVYAINPKTMEAYDMASYQQALQGTGELVLVGKIVKVGKVFRLDRL